MFPHVFNYFLPSKYIFLQELLLDNDDNILVSPFSAETLLALTQSGAFGGTGSEIRTTLHLATTKEAVEAEIQQVMPSIQSDMFSLKTVNKIYVENGLSVKESFKSVAESVYNAALENINFAEANAAREEINDWVAKETNNKISNLLSSDDVGPDTIAILVNALYFQANWSVPFIPQHTKKASFFISNEKTIDTTMMHLDAAYYNYAESEELDAQILEIPFSGEDAKMVVILPNKKEGIALLEKQVDATLVEPAFTKEFVEIYLPKFQIESTVDFNNVLQEVNILHVFLINVFKIDYFFSWEFTKLLIRIKQILAELLESLVIYL